MFIIMNQFEEAASTALRISDDLRSRGEYRSSHDILFDIIDALKRHKQVISSELKNGLMVIHSYLLVKPMKEYNRLYSALLLRRLSKHVSRFPKHGSTILTSAVIELFQIGMKRSSFDAAVKLMTPEFQDQIKPDLLKKIQTIVRRKDQTEAEEPTTPCPVCGNELFISELYCGSCKSSLPSCSLTEMHFAKNYWCECPNCKFPASHLVMNEKKESSFCQEKIPVPEIIQNPKIE
jgi:WD repeat-containing protein 19